MDRVLVKCGQMDNVLKVSHGTHFIYVILIQLGVHDSISHSHNYCFTVDITAYLQFYRHIALSYKIYLVSYVVRINRSLSQKGLELLG